MTLLQHYQLSLYLTTTATLLLGGFLLLYHHHYRGRMAKIFGLYSLLVALWSYCQAMAGSTTDPHTSVLWARAMFLVVPLFPVVLLHVYSVLLERNLRSVYRSGYCLVLAFLPFTLGNWFLEPGGSLAFLPSFPRAGPLFLAYNAAWIGWIVYAIWVLAQGVKAAPTLRMRRQRQLLFFAFTFGYAAGCTNYLYFYGIVFPPIQPIATYGVPVAFLVIAYGIFAYGLFDIQLVLRRSILSAIVLGLLAAGYFGFVAAADKLLRLTLAQHHILALTLTSATTLCLGLLVFIAGPKKRLNQVFGLYSLAIAWWATFEVLVVSSPDTTTAALWSYIEWPGVFFIAPTFLHTVYLFTGQHSRKLKHFLVTGYAISICFLLLHLCAGSVLTYMPAPLGYAPFHNRLSPIGFIIPFVFVTLVNVALVQLWRAHKQATGRRKVHLRYLLWGSIVGYLGGSSDWFFTLGFHIPPLNPFGLYTVPCYSIALTYAVLQYRLFEFSLVIRKSLIYSVVITLLTTGFFTTVHFLEKASQLTFGYQSTWLSLAAFAVMAVLFQPLKIGVQRALDWLVFHQTQEQLAKRMERLEREAQEVEKLKAVSTMAAGLCHELRNPLQIIQTHTEFLPDRFGDLQFQEKCREVLRVEIARVNDLLKQLMDFAKPKQPGLKPLEPHKILNSTLDFLNNELIRRAIDLERRFEADGVRIRADSNQFRQVVFNLAANAIQAIRSHGRIIVSTAQEDGWFVMEISDTGPGIDPEIMKKLFEPFNTGKPDGTGLGLSIVHTIIREHGGRIEVKNRPGHGATFAIRLPTE